MRLLLVLVSLLSLVCHKAPNIYALYVDNQLHLAYEAYRVLLDLKKFGEEGNPENHSITYGKHLIGEYSQDDYYYNIAVTFKTWRGWVTQQLSQGSKTINQEYTIVVKHNENNSLDYEIYWEH